MSNATEQTVKPQNPQEAVLGLAKLATELMQYASYAEIVKLLGINQVQIRDVCDRIVELNHDLERMLDAADVPMFDEEGRMLERIERFEFAKRASGEASAEETAHVNAVALRNSVAEAEKLRAAADNIAPYLIYTIGEESPGHHPTMPSAVGAFLHAFGIETQEKRLARTRAKLGKQ